MGCNADLTSPTCIDVGSSNCNVLTNCTCNQNPCQCRKSEVATPCAPFYTCTPNIQEDHTKLLIQQDFNTTLVTAGTFNMPACSDTTTIVIPGLKTIQPGGYLWNQIYGYLKVISFDYVTGSVVVQNLCNTNNAVPGTLVPSCTKFNVVDPPYVEDSPCDGPGVFSTANFTVPALAGTVSVSVTDTVGLLIGATVQVGSFKFTVDSITNATTIVLKNDFTVTPGVIIYAQDAFGNCITPVTPYSGSPCSVASVSSGSLVVCHNGVTSTLEATALHQVPVCTNAATNTFEAQTLAIPVETCSFLTAGFSLFNGINIYTISLNSTAAFSLGELVIIHYPDLDAASARWKVTNINVNGHDMTIESLIPNTFAEAIPIDTNVCIAPCCEQIQWELDNFGQHICGQDWSPAFKSQAQMGGVEQNTALNPAGAFTGSAAALVFTNNTCNPMSIMLVIEVYVRGHLPVYEFDWARIHFGMQHGYTTAAIPSVPGTPTYAEIDRIDRDYTCGIGDGEETCDPYGAKISEKISYSTIIVLPAQHALNFAAYATFNFVNYATAKRDACASVTVSGLGHNPWEGAMSPASEQMVLDAIGTRITALGVTVQSTP